VLLRFPYKRLHEQRMSSYKKAYAGVARGRELHGVDVVRARRWMPDGRGAGWARVQCMYPFFPTGNAVSSFFAASPLH
jgi:hypothetical protein